MIKPGMTISEAAHAWVGEMNAFPYSMIKTLIAADPDSWTEVTMPAVGNRVYVYDRQSEGEITEAFANGKYRVDVDRGGDFTVSADEFELVQDTTLPMWGTLWSFGDSCDDWWLSDDGGIKKMSECGFRIYEHEEWGYFFGIDGAGYDFYEAHWIPLYKVRGLQWHDPKLEVKKND